MNNRRYKELRDGKMVEEKWEEVKVGDVIRMEKEKLVEEDVLMMKKSEKNGICLIEKEELDGEKKLKWRKWIMEKEEMSKDE